MGLRDSGGSEQVPGLREQAAASDFQGDQPPARRLGRPRALTRKTWESLGEVRRRGRWGFCHFLAGGQRLVRVQPALRASAARLGDVLITSILKISAQRKTSWAKVYTE